MTKYNTGNPVGSADPRDRHDNTINLDEVVNSAEATMVDRLGHTKLTLAGMSSAAGDATIAINSAENSLAHSSLAKVEADRAKSEVVNATLQVVEAVNGALSQAYSARDAAFVNANVYADQSIGMAAVADGEQFQVLVADELIRYRRDEDVATEVARYPAASSVEQALEMASAPEIKSSFEFYSSDFDAPSFVMTDETGRQVMAFDEMGLPFFNVGAEFHADDMAIAYAQTDAAGRVLIAWDEQGEHVAGGSGAPDPLLPYISGSELRAVGAEDTIAAELGQVNVLSVHPGNDRHVRAVIDWPALSGSRSVAVANGYLIPDSDRVLHVVIGLGQSLMVGSNSADTPVSINPLYPDDVLMFDTGANSDVRMGLATQGVQPELDPYTLVGFLPLSAQMGQGSGSRGETPMESNANLLASEARGIGARFKTLSFTAAQGGTIYANLKKGSTVYTNMLTALTKAKLLANLRGWKIIVDACLLKHGEGDNSNENYFNDLIEWQMDVDTDVKAITGQQATVQFIMGQPSSGNGGMHSVRAMARAHAESPYHHLSGPDYPFLNEYHTDLLHFTGPGYVHVGEQMARAWMHALWSHRKKSQVVRIIGASITGNTVRLDYECPKPPLVFDTTTVTERDVKGYRFFDDGAQVSITSATIINDGTTGTAQIELQLASTPVGVQKLVEYGLHGYSGGRSEETIARGNVRDSDTRVSVMDGRRLYNWAIHQHYEIQGE